MRKTTVCALIWGLAALAVGAPPAAAKPLRVATLVPWVGEALLRVPEKVTVVATTRRWSQAPTPAGQLDLGDGHSPNLERLVSAAPELVIADRRWHSRLGPSFVDHGFEVVWIEADTVASTLAALTDLGRRVGAEAELRAATQAVKSRLSQLQVGPKRQVLALFGAPGSFLVISHRTWLGSLLESLGYELLVPATGRETMPGYLPAADEFLAVANPDLVLLLAHGDPAAVARAFTAEWQRVRHRAPRVVALEPELFGTNPGLRLAEAGAALVTLTTAPANGGG